MKFVSSVAMLTFLTGCATMHYTSHLPASEVSSCIASGWGNAPRSGIQAPIELSDAEPCYFVTFGLYPTFPSPIIFGTKHPFNAVWVEVCPSPGGSATEYHRAMQFTHKIIDGVVERCQKTE